MLAEVGTLALSVVTLLLQRLDKRREDVRRSPDLQMALLALSESLGRWAEAASKTTWVYVHPTQGKLADEVIRWLSDEGAADAASAQAILATYAPELREQLSQVAATRAQQLDEIRRVMAEDPPNPWLRDSSDLPKRLVESAADLKKAKRQLDAFIRATFPRPPTAVRD